MFSGFQNVNQHKKARKHNKQKKKSLFLQLLKQFDSPRTLRINSSEELAALNPLIGNRPDHCISMH
jgi:hypothetical protein